MNKMTQLLVVYAAAAHMFHSMMAVVIESRKRKCHNHAPMGRINYALIEDRDRSRIDYLNNKIWKNDVIFCAEFSSQTCDRGKKTSTSFKNVHLNNYAKAVNDHFKINMIGDQIFNHLKTLKKSTLELTT
jgi:hypothetical protein